MLLLPPSELNLASPPLADSIRTLAGTIDASPADLSGVLRPLWLAFAEHRLITEGDGGLYAEVVGDAPRLARAVHELVADHRTIDSAIQRLAVGASGVSPDADELRRSARLVLDHLHRHRQQDADLVHEAYARDLGGE